MIHFVYAAPTRPIRRVVTAAQRLGLPISYVGRRDGVRTGDWPIRAPLSITAHVYQALGRLAPTRLYDVRERVTIGGDERDVLMGHYLAGDDGGVWQRSMDRGRFAVRIAMNPLHHHMPEVCGEIDAYVPRVDRIFGIMGPYWYETWPRSALAHWYPKIVPIDMAIDIRAYPRVKRSFNAPGRRRFLYIGWAGAQKGTHLLSILFGLAKGQKCIAVGPATPLANVECRPRARFTPEYLARLARECDVVLVPGVSDANPTVILEAMAWGFPVCCTPQSGYHGLPEILPLSITDMRHNLRVLETLQEASERDLIERADAARALVSTRYTWDRFESTLVDALVAVAAEKGVSFTSPDLTRRARL